MPTDQMESNASTSSPPPSASLPASAPSPSPSPPAATIASSTSMYHPLPRSPDISYSILPDVTPVSRHRTSKPTILPYHIPSNSNSNQHVEDFYSPIVTHRRTTSRGTLQGGRPTSRASIISSTETNVLTPLNSFFYRLFCCLDVINPESRFYRYWLILVLTFICMNAFITPYRLTIGYNALEHESVAFLILEAAADFTFLCNIFVKARLVWNIYIIHYHILCSDVSMYVSVCFLYV